MKLKELLPVVDDTILLKIFDKEFNKIKEVKSDEENIRDYHECRILEIRSMLRDKIYTGISVMELDKGL